MRTLSFILFAAAFIFIGCGSKELSKEEAVTLLKKEYGFPKVYDHTIYCGDPQEAKAVLDAGLETQGLLTVDRTQKLMDAGKPLIHFTEKAKPYLLDPGSAEAKEKFTSTMQNVKLADQDIKEVTSVVTDPSSKLATVTYTVEYKNLSPFSSLIERDLKKDDTGNTAIFALSDQDGWVLQKK